MSHDHDHDHHDHDHHDHDHHDHDHHDHDHAHGEHDAHANEHHRPHGAEGRRGPHTHPDDDEAAQRPHDHAPPAALLNEGDGRGQVLFFDAFSGVAGDMTIAALLDLGVPLLVIERALAMLPVEGFHVHRGHVHRSGIVATTFDVHLETSQPERTYRAIDDMLAGSDLEPRTRDLTRRIFRRLAEAEASVHRMPLDDVHFHEVGAVDAIVDIVGAAAALTYLDAEIVGSPLPMGRGFVKARHGVLPLPAPATVACLRGVPTYGTDIDFELVTPTGAAILATVATRFERWPTIAVSRVGFGGGHKDLAEQPNVLRLVLGSPTSGGAEETSLSHVVVETNVDDLTGEMAAHAIEALFSAGALDAWATPITMKKGRPALTLSALAPNAAAEAVAGAMMRETTSIGVRKTPASRTERPRRTVTVDTPFGAVRVKISEGPFGPPQKKPEFDDCAAAAKAHGVPVREVVMAALAAAK